jgi:hypothetical protein
MSAENLPVVCMIPGDLHLTEAGLSNHKTAIWAVEQANDFIRPDFVQFIGDNVQDATDEQFDLFRALAGMINCPWHALVGDHDAQGDPLASAFRDRVGDPYGSLRLHGFRFLRLNTQEGRAVGLSDTQLDWFRSEVDAAMAAEERTVVFQHNYPYQIRENYALWSIALQDWIAPLPASNLSKGVHRLDVQAVDSSGGVGEQVIEFAVDPTGRYTAVPRVQPVVTATKFC